MGNLVRGEFNVKKIICIILSILFSLLSLTACSSEPSPSKIAKKQATAIINCFKTGETDELKSLFCEQVASTHDLDTEIQEAFDFIDGNIISNGKWYGMGEGGKSVRNGVVAKSDIHPIIKNLKTDTEKKYKL